MLTRADYGLHITGRVDQVGEVTHRSGTAKSGNAYSFFQQPVSVAVGGEMYEIVYRSDDDPKGPLVNVELDDVVRLPVKSPRVFNGRISFEGVM